MLIGGEKYKKKKKKKKHEQCCIVLYSIKQGHSKWERTQRTLQAMLL
jgi:hypothetical protein